MIKRIELHNFMSHRHTVIEPAEGLTVLVGPNNCGKSAVVRALQMLCHNPNSGFVLRHGESQCDVIVETHEGHLVQWTRKKSSAASYVIDGQTYDRLRRRVPDELHQILHMPKVVCDNDDFDIHFGEQSEPVFLLKNRGKAAAQFFASSSDAAHLVAMQSLHKSKVTIAKRDQKQLALEKDRLERQLESLSPVDELDTQLNECEARLESLRKSSEKIEALKIMISALKAGRQKRDRLIEYCSAMKTLDPVPDLQDERPLVQLLERLGSSERRLKLAASSADQFQPLDVPPPLSDESKLSRLLGSIQRVAGKQIQLSRAAMAFDELMAPLPQAPAGELAAMIKRLKSREQNFSSTAKSLEVIVDMPEPPEVHEPEKLQSLHQAMLDLQAIVKKQTDQIKQTDSKLELLTGEFEQWVLENPRCPTCGGPTDTQHVLRHPGDEHV